MTAPFEPVDLFTLPSQEATSTPDVSPAPLVPSTPGPSREAVVLERLREAEAAPRDAYARALKDGPVGVPARVVAEDPDSFMPTTVERDAELIRDRPVLERTILNDPEFAWALPGSGGFEGLARAHDDFSPFDWLRRTTIATRDQTQLYTALIESGFRAVPRMQDALFGTNETTAENLERIAELQQRMAEKQGSIEDVGIAGQTIALGIGMMPYSLLALGARGLGSATALIPGVGPVVAPVARYAFPMAAVGIVEGGSWFNETMAQHPEYDPKDVATAALAVGAINGALELLPLEQLVDTYKGALTRSATRLLADKGFRDFALYGVRRTAIQMGTEGFTEFTQELTPVAMELVLQYDRGEIGADDVVRGMFSADALSRYADSAYKGALGAAFIPGVSAVAGTVTGTMQARRAEANRELFQQIAETSRANASIIERMPDRYKKLVDEVVQENGSVEGVYVEPSQLEAAYGETPETQAALADLNKRIPDLMQRIQDAKATGGKVRFSPGEFATYVAGSDRFDTLADHLSFAEDQPSAAEAKQLGGEDYLARLEQRLESLIAQDPANPLKNREMEGDFSLNLEAIFEQSLPAVSKPVRQRSARLFARMVSRIAEMDGQDPLALMVDVLDRLKFEQRTELDSQAEVDRANAFGTDRFRAEAPDVTTELGQLAGRHPELERVSVRERGNDIVLEDLVVRRGERKQGIGSRFMDDLVETADRLGKRVVLTTGVRDSATGTTSAARLKRFYKRFGFVENKGKDYSISENMLRTPRGSDRYKQAAPAERIATRTPKAKDVYRPGIHTEDVVSVEAIRGSAPELLVKLASTFGDVASYPGMRGIVSDGAAYRALERAEQALSERKKQKGPTKAEVKARAALDEVLARKPAPLEKGASKEERQTRSDALRKHERAVKKAREKLNAAAQARRDELTNLAAAVEQARSIATSQAGQDIEAIKTFVKDNLRALWEGVAEPVRSRTREWYIGANSLADRFGARYGYDLRASAAVIAALSPQKDWNQNVSLAERVFEVWVSAQDQVLTPEMIEGAIERKREALEADKKKTPLMREGELEEFRRYIGAIEGMKLSEIEDNSLAGVFIRAYSQGIHPREYRLVTPEGDFGALVTTDNDPDASRGVQWNGYSAIANAVAILRNPTLEVISARLGDQHKVRNFYNNIVDPTSAVDITIDTHAVGAGLMRALSGTDTPVTHNFSGPGSTVSGTSGTYAIYADAYRELAAELDVLPRELQSVTWEAIRAMIPARQKNGLKPQLDAIWSRVDSGEINAEQARAEVFGLTNGIPEPDSVGDAGAARAPVDSSFRSELPESRDGLGPDRSVRGPGGNTDGGSPLPSGEGRAGGAADQLAAAFARWFEGSKVVDENGAPLVMYHGSGASISEFSYEFIGQGNDALGSGFYFTSEESTGNAYTKARIDPSTPKIGGESQPTLHKVYLAIKNPLDAKLEKPLTRRQIEQIIKRSPDLDDTLTNWGDVDYEGRATVLRKAIDSSFEVFSDPENRLLRSLWSLESGFYSRESAPAFLAAVRDVLGYDGVRETFSSGEQHWVAWFPNQIKSVDAAAFDPASPNIYQQPAFHGSPDGRWRSRFSLTKIGTGQGAQAFGWGLYFSTARGIAEVYRMMRGRPSLTYKGVRITANPTESREFNQQTDLIGVIDRDVTSPRIARNALHSILNVYEGDLERAIQDVRLNTEHLIEGYREHYPDNFQTLADDSFRELAFLDSLDPADIKVKMPGQTVKAEIPESSDLLDWHKPMAEQPEGVRARIREMLAGMGDDDAMVGLRQLVEAGQIDGAEFYRMLGRILMSQQAEPVNPQMLASQALGAAGVPGLQYNAGTQSGWTSSDVNFVIWDEAAIQVVERFRARAQAGATRGQLVVDRVVKRMLLQLSQENLNDSTLVHELAHAALELVLDVSEGEGASAEIQAYARDTLAFLGVESRDQITAEHHERWAESWELYLREGRAPTEELQPLFSWFRARLVEIYKAVRELLKFADHDLEFVPLFDRLLATQEEMEASATRETVFSAFAGSSALEDLTDREKGTVSRELEAARRAERARLEAAIAREQDRVARQQRSEIRERVTAEVMAEPLQQLVYWLRRGKLPNGEDFTALSSGKMSGADIDAITGDAGWKRALPRGTYTTQGGTPPAMVALAWGYNSVEEMLDHLKTWENPRDVVARRVQAEAEAKGLVATAEERAAAAAEALAGPERHRLYEAERRIARRLAGLQRTLEPAERRAAAGEEAATVDDSRAALEAARANLEAAIKAGRPPSELDLLQIELKRAEAGIVVAKDARADQAAARRNAKSLPPRIPAQVYRDAARRVLRRTRARDLKHNLGLWRKRRFKASREKVDAAAARDWARLEQLIEQEMLANALVEEAVEMQKRVPKMRRHLKELGKASSKTRQRLLKHAFEPGDLLGAGPPINLMDVIDGILATVSFENIPASKLYTADRITRYAEKLEAEQGIQIPLPPWVIDIEATPDTYQDIRLEQLIDLYTTVAALEKRGLDLAREAEGDALAEETAELEEMRAALEGQRPTALALAKSLDPALSSRAKRWTTGVVGSLLSLETIADYLDKLNPEGPFNRYLIRRIQESKALHKATRDRIAQRINESWERNYDRKGRGDFYAKKIWIESLGEYMTKNAILMVAAQMGNEHGQRALREAENYGLSDRQLSEILSHVTREDIRFLDETIETIETLWPLASAVERKMNGVVPPKVEATPWQLPDGTWMKGGYFPLDFNPDLKERAHEYEQRKLADFLMPAAGGRVMSKPGAMHARKQTSGGLTIRADFMSTLTKHVEDISRDVAWRETIIRLARYFQKLEPDLTRVIGTQAYRELRPYLKRLASPQRTLETANPWLARVAGEARVGVGFAAMAFKLTSAIVQTTGFLPAMHRVGVANVVHGYTSLYLTGNPWPKIQQLRELIPDLKDRAETFDRDAQSEALRLNPIDVRLPGKSARSLQAYSMHFGYYLLGLIDSFTASAVAQGALRQAMNGEVAGIEAGDLEAAARYAGKIVRRTQGSGAAADIAPIMADKGLTSLLTVMMTYSNTQLQQAMLAGALSLEERASRKEARAKGLKFTPPRNRPRFLAFWLFTFVMAPILEAIMRQAVQQFGEDPPDEEEFLERLAANIGLGWMGGIPILRELQGKAMGFDADTPITDVVDAVWGVVSQSYDALTLSEDFDGEKFVRAWATFGTYIGRAPSKHMLDLYEDISQEPFGRGKR